MRSGKTHSALLEIEGQKERNSRPWERRAGPTHLTCGVSERNIYTDPKRCRAFSLWSSSYLGLSLHPFSVSPTLASLPLSLQMPSLCFIPSLTCILFLLRLCLSLLVLLFSSAHVCSDGLFRLYLVKLQQNTSFRRQENRERCIIGVSQRFIVTQLQTRVHRFTFKQ